MKKSKCLNLILTIMLIVIVVVGLVIGLVFIVNEVGDVADGVGNLIEISDIKDKITAGEVIDKRTEDGYTTGGGSGFIFNPSSGNINYGIGFGDDDTYVPVRYYITIEYNYEHKGKIIEDKKEFEVERDVYLTYDIGDYFDSQNFTYISETEVSEEITS